MDCRSKQSITSWSGGDSHIGRMMIAQFEAPLTGIANRADMGYAPLMAVTPDKCESH